MTTLLTVAGILAYAVADLYAARHLYGRWRARKIDKEFKRTSIIYGRRSDEERLREAHRYWAETDRPFVMVGALAAATAWPLTLAALVLARWMDSAPTRASAELQADRDQMARRIAELERELGIK
ncbi:hypothetical protein [Streptomyces sp. NPDC057052]|uniref:hypothetical protein n=1 Tax=Streptomyces sp. NPDC057052 TaxID=3346010 RepID=UPI00363F5E5F